MANAILLLTLAAISAGESWNDSPCTIREVDRRYTPTSRCLGCHDGTAAPGLSGDPSEGRGQHPVGMEYAAAYARVAGGTTGLRPPGSIDARLVLPHGTVSCVTCHDGGSPDHLAIPANRLCVACHDL